jgi:hypothetical protein
MAFGCGCPPLPPPPLVPSGQGGELVGPLKKLVLDWVLNGIHYFVWIYILDEEIERGINYLKNSLLCVIGKYWRGDGFGGLQMGKATKQIRHVVASHVLSSVVDRSDPIP